MYFLPNEVLYQCITITASPGKISATETKEISIEKLAYQPILHHRQGESSNQGGETGIETVAIYYF
jgi:hypothetical protein